MLSSTASPSALVAPTNPYASTPDEALRMFASARFVRFAAADEDGRAILRSLNAVVLDGKLCFHGGDHGEKLGLVGRRVVASVEEVVAQVPSYWVHPTLACPASTYYLSALAEGVVRRIDDLAHKARVLSALMERFQPEGGYTPIRADDSRYAPVLTQLLVAELVPERLSAKRKLGQKRSAREIESVLEGLWRRGAPSDMRAIRLVHEAHPKRPTPSFLRGPASTTFCVSPDAQDADSVCDLLQGAYWTAGLTRDEIWRAHLGSSAWVVARDPAGAVVASARAISDAGRYAWVMDVIVHPDLRGRGLGHAIMALLLEHPALRSLRRVGLATRDGETFYETLGFSRARSENIVMVRERP